jgi:hypothetical protein
MSVLNTRRALRWVGVLMILSLLLSACAPAAAPASAPAAGGDAAAAPGDELTRANTLVFAADMTDLITLDPAVAYEFGGTAGRQHLRDPGLLQPRRAGTRAACWLSPGRSPKTATCGR